MQTQGAVTGIQQMMERTGRWRRASPIQRCLRASSKPRPEVCSSFSPHPQQAPLLTETKWGEGGLGAAPYPQP